MRPFAFFDHRVRGFRIVELGGLVVLLALVLTVYLAKTGAGGTRSDIDRLQAQIGDEQSQIRILKAEVATLEQPERLEALSSRYLGLAPLSARREVTLQGLADVARISTVDNKPLPGMSDPLTAVGSPDLAAESQSAATAPAVKPPAPTPATTTQAAGQTAPAPERRPTGKSGVLKIARADTPARPVSHARSDVSDSAATDVSAH
jgi:cell division protein FtsL